jgi:Zn finger protein HypA/HybF involved in hydrogenase expression
MSLERKLRRAQAKKGKKNAENAMAEKVALFEHLPDKCLTCETPFDKMKREQVMTWNVVVRQEEKKVHLYCPDCWNKAKEIIDGLKERLANKKEGTNAVLSTKK